MRQRQALDLCFPGVLLNGVLNLNNTNLYLHSNVIVHLHNTIVRSYEQVITSFCHSFDFAKVT